MLAKQMNRFLASTGASKCVGTLAIGVLAFASGCSICPSPYDYDYGTYGTKTPRSDMRSGRVGSVFSDPALTGRSVEAMSVDGSVFPMDVGVPMGGTIEGYDWSAGGGEVIEFGPGQVIPGQIIIE
jgi:hypothetical protein